MSMRKPKQSSSFDCHLRLKILIRKRFVFFSVIDHQLVFIRITSSIFKIEIIILFWFIRAIEKLHLIVSLEIRSYITLISILSFSFFFLRWEPMKFSILFITILNQRKLHVRFGVFSNLYYEFFDYYLDYSFFIHMSTEQ